MPTDRRRYKRLETHAIDGAIMYNILGLLLIFGSFSSHASPANASQREENMGTIANCVTGAKYSDWRGAYETDDCLRAFNHFREDMRPYDSRTFTFTSAAERIPFGWKLPVSYTCSEL